MLFGAGHLSVAFLSILDLGSMIDFVIDDKTDYEYAMYTYTVGGLGPGRIKTADGGCFQLWGIKTTPSQSAQFMALEAFALA